MTPEPVGLYARVVDLQHDLQKAQDEIDRLRAVLRSADWAIGQLQRLVLEMPVEVRAQ